MQDLFSHSIENKVSNIEIYNEQKPRLKLNCWVILFVLLEGRKLSAIDFVNGIKFKEMQKPIFMVEYRKRFNELKAAGIELMEERLPNGTKEKRIPQFKLNEYKLKYSHFMTEVLIKLQ